jgi:hypothetical protein
MNGVLLATVVLIICVPLIYVLLHAPPLEAFRQDSEPEPLPGAPILDSLADLIATPAANYTDEMTLAEFKAAMMKLRLGPSVDTTTWSDSGVRKTEKYLKTAWEAAVRGATSGRFEVIDEAVRAMKTEGRGRGGLFFDVEWVLHREGKRVGFHVQVSGVARGAAVVWTNVRVLGIVPDDRIISRMPTAALDMANLGRDAESEIYCGRMRNLKQEYGFSIPANPDFDCGFE